MPFCSKCGLFFAKGNVCSCVSGASPAEAAISPRLAGEEKKEKQQEKPIRIPAVSKQAKPKDAARAPPAAVSRPAPAAASDRGTVVHETSSASSKYCGECCEPRTLCKCAKEEGVPFYSKQPTAAPIQSAAFCPTCSEPRALCSCNTSASAAPASKNVASPRRAGEARLKLYLFFCFLFTNDVFRDASNAQYNEPVRAAAQSEVSKEATVLGRNMFCTDCGEPTKLCRCQSIREGRQIVDPVTGKWL